MKKLQSLLIALLMSIAVVGKADNPTLINMNSHDFVLVVSPCKGMEHYSFKLNTKTGEVWCMRAETNVEKIKCIKCNGIPDPEGDIFPGRFRLEFMNIDETLLVYVFDSKTGDIWAMKYGRTRNNEYTFRKILT